MVDQHAGRVADQAAAVDKLDIEYVIEATIRWLFFELKNQGYQWIVCQRTDFTAEFYYLVFVPPC